MPNASSTTSTTVWIAIPPRMLPTATPTLCESAALDRDRDLRQVRRDRQQDQAAEAAPSAAGGRARPSRRRAGSRRPTPPPRRGEDRAPEARATYCGSVRRVSTIAFDVEAVRARFSRAAHAASRSSTAPAARRSRTRSSTRSPTIFRESNANVGGPYGDEHPHRGADRAGARNRRALPRLRLPTNTTFGPNMTTLNFALTRTAARQFEAGDEILVTGSTTTRTSLPGSSSRTTSASSSASSGSTTTRRSTSTTSHGSSADARRSSRFRSRRTRSARSPTRGGSQSSRTRPARSRGPTPCTSRRTARSTSRSSASTCCICSPYKFFGPHLGARVRARESCSSAGGRTRCALADRRRPAAASRPARSRTSCSPASSQPSTTSSRSAGTAIQAHERELGERFLAGLPEASRCTACRRWTAACRRSLSRVDGAYAARGRGAPRRPRHRRLARRLLRASK